ncbi:NAD(P)H-dependent oxidoreductase [Dehalobacterium formicoaceticum]|uniref:NAD(P)H-dependent oxidoreductase n=1 Tax=Dehalobacterium formicoaceticum TaxID=51515 RepID=A0ABT1XZW3_9FIRM|nr:NAD(P)H-dependent oxidoreductase [Dehalobacterium formicoaceticum]MCR6544155.1 NAD(P)H-dependent oxidoreductase [Dehalobacterium formicoaceticum]
MTQQKILLLNGSPRKKGTSFSFARTIKILTEKQGHEGDIIHIIDYFNQKKDFSDLKVIIPQYDIIGLITPLYVDTLPYPVIWFLEELTWQASDLLRNKRFFALGQCGFPNVKLCESLLESCRFFAEETEMKWLGGLGYGGGSIIDGALLENLGKKGEKITHAFQIALDDLFADRKISFQVQELLTVNIPPILYTPLAAFLNFRAKQNAQKFGVKDLSRKFYLE